MRGAASQKARFTRSSVCVWDGGRVAACRSGGPEGFEEL